jgi:putative adhesin
MDGPNFSLSGSDTVDRGNAANFSYFGTTNNTQITFGGNASFTGTIYAPQADFSLGGGGSSTYDFVGASVTRSVSMNGHFNFHFDENLLLAGPK